MEINLINSMEEVSARAWNNCLMATDRTNYPFLRHEFLSSLEKTGCIGGSTGWLSRHLLAMEGKEVLGILPQYEKHHSHGEFVFDWQWASAWEQAGGNYYPKLLTASPFSPVPGPRILCNDQAIRKALLDAQQQMMADAGHSSLHLLFTEDQDATELQSRGYLERLTWQYQWFNQNYASFDDFLATLTAKKRKQIRRERRLVRESGLTLDWKGAAELHDDDWQNIWRCYAQTYAEHYSTPYLGPDFFPALAKTMPDQLLVFTATRNERLIAASVCLRDDEALYGRYWGSFEHIDCLHFEACYYAGIEYAIEHGLKKYDAGVQGEHKLARGFEPVAARSYHWIAHEGFRAAVGDFLERESLAVEGHLDELDRHRPYKDSS